MIRGFINSFQTMGTVDGPGVRFVVFMQGCPLRCIYCHNPETWNSDFKIVLTPFELLDKVKRYKSYFGKDGGVTISGGEPLIQQEFVYEFFKLCRAEKIKTALDTSGCVLNDFTENLLIETDLVILDVKFTTEDEYKEYTGGSLEKTLEFLNLTNELNRDVWIRQVIINGINDNEDNIKRLKGITQRYKNIKRVELLPFKKLCLEKYEGLGLDFKLKNSKETTDKEICELNKLLN